jgi:hypothetical protein
MRNVPAAAAVMLSLSLVLPAAAAPCPGIVVFQDSFTAPNPALDASAIPQSKVTIQGGKAEVTFLQAGMGRNEEYLGIQYGDANLCGTFATATADKAENQVAGIIFWATDYSAFYSFQIMPASGQFVILQMVPGTGWTTPLAWTASAAIVKTMGAANTLQVQTKGKTATLFINGQQVGTFSGAPPSGGGVVGFSASTSSTSLDTWDVTDFSVAVP